MEAKARNPYARYFIDKDIQKAGIWFEDEEIRVRVTFAGDENTRYTKMHKMKMKQYENQIRQDNLPDKKYYELLAEVYAATVVMAIEVKKYMNDEDIEGEFVPGIYDIDGNIVEYNEANICMTFGLSQRLFNDVIKLASNFNLYRQGQKEGDTKNS